MLTLNREQTTALDYSVVNTSIQETFTAIDRFECFAVDEILQMREQQLYLQAGYKNFSEYCQRELYAWGGYRRINQLLGAKKVIDAVGELGGHIKNERQARPLLRLVKEPEKLFAAVSLALKDNPDPSVSDFAAAANIVVPQLPRKKQFHQEPMVPKVEEPVVPQKAIVTVSQQSHPRYGEEGTIEADAPNHWQQIVTFADGERLLINNADLDAASVPFPRGRNYPPEYTEAMSTTGYAYAALKEQHKLELERLSQELRIGLQTEATAKAEAQVQEQIQSLQQLFKQQKQENIQLQQRLSEMEGLRKLEIENQELQQRIQELEHAVEQRPSQEWGNTMTQQATKALNKQVKQALEKTIDLRSLAVEPPKENAQECLRLMGMALKNLASAMNNTQALEAAAIILGSEPTQGAIAYRAEQLSMLPQAVSDIRQVLSKPGCTWQDYWAVAQEYEVIKQDYWAELTTQEIDLIAALQIASQPPVIQVGSIVAYADPYYTLYLARGEVVEDLGEEEVLVAWDHWKNEGKKTSRYFRNELRFWQPQ
ncbi:ATPase involved in DNA repair (plasmid) [Nostoc flagelliforme CCNUN1]|uniref:ATPase involved in DNA repair n=1 Tax=Nostoc flagelliforme CCNUN1 TaxID=2038116 RepID=A0A2K8T7Q2_9NOSO|nr:hypothetical protein [Nostoc flagelliforme]AUB43680.1 ATPase involved in DNA repair [Nostoc flagelliforme CCNUN1]